MDLDECINVLTKLVGFESISARPNEPIVSYIQDYLAQHGIESTLSYDESGLKANLFATIGPIAMAGWFLMVIQMSYPLQDKTGQLLRLH